MSYEQSVISELKQLERSAQQLLGRMGRLERELKRTCPANDMRQRLDHCAADHAVFTSQANRYITLSADIPAVNGERGLVSTVRGYAKKLEAKWRTLDALAAERPEIFITDRTNGHSCDSRKKKRQGGRHGR